MTKNLLKASLWGILTLSTLYSCRTEDGAMMQKQVEDKRFAVFVPKSGETINYANGFASLMKKYDQVHLTNISGINNKPVIKSLSASTNKSVSSFQDIGKYVEFNIRSQTVNEENGNKWVVFPKVENDKVTGLIIATLRDKETQVVFTDLDINDGFYAENIPLFQQALDRYLSKKKSKLNAVASIKSSAIASVDPGADPGTDPGTDPKEHDIEGVTVKGKPKTSDNGTNGLPSGPSTPASCEQVEGCYNPVETGGGSSDASTSFEQWAAQHIDDRNLKDNKCANDVYQTLKNRSGLFYNLLGNFKGGSSILNLSFIIKPISSPPGTITTGQTNPENIKNGYITITMNPDALGSTDLGIATTYIHEMIHAKMIHDLVNVGWNGDNIKEINPESLPALLEAYSKELYKDENSQHRFMTEYYIPKMVAALGQFDGYNHSKADYENLAWTGLQRTKAYDALSQAKKDKITEANNTFNRKAPCGK